MIKELRARCGLTQEDLTKIAGVRRETVLFIEKGEYNPSLNLAYAIAKAFKTSIDELFLFDDRSGKGGHAHFRASPPFSSL